MNFISSFIDLIHKEEYLKITWIIIWVIILIVPSTSIIYIYRPNLFFNLELAKLSLLIFCINVLLFLSFFIWNVCIKSLIIDRQNYKLRKLNESINKELWLNENTISPAYKSKSSQIYNLKGMQNNSFLKLEKDVSLTDVVIEVFIILVSISLGSWFIKCIIIFSEGDGHTSPILEINLGEHLKYLFWILGVYYVLSFISGVFPKNKKQKEVELLFNKIKHN